MNNLYHPPLSEEMRKLICPNVYCVLLGFFPPLLTSPHRYVNPNPYNGHKSEKAKRNNYQYTCILYMSVYIHTQISTYA